MSSVPYTAKTVTAGGFHTRYLEAGDPTNPTVVLIHDGGFGTTAELCWEPMIERLGRDYHLLAPELLGWGGTDKVVFLDRSPYAARIPHIAAFLRELEVESHAFVGASFGGSLLMRAAVEAGNPWQISRAVSISGTGGPYRLKSGIEALGEYTPSLEEAERMTSLIVKSTEGLADHIRQRHENSLIPGHWESLMAPRLHNPAVERQLRPDPFLDQLAGVTIPVLLVEGHHDPLLETGWSKKLAQLSPSLTAIELDSGHEANIDAPDELCAAITRFLSTSDGATHA
jgi:pimeloyl-ACP methyl ester carboxylesterase